MHRLRRLLALVGSSFVLASCVPKNESNDRCLSYEPQVVTLEGTLGLVLRHGPPGYGETPDVDQKLQVPVLRLPAPIDVCGDATSELNRKTVLATREIQVILPTGIDGQRFIDTNVKATGSLSQAISGRHFTDVILLATAVETAN